MRLIDADRLKAVLENLKAHAEEHGIFPAFSVLVDYVIEVIGNQPTIVPPPNDPLTLEELRGDSRARCEVTDGMLSFIDILVDGPFVEEKKDLNLRFRGSSNQRILNVPASLAARAPVLWGGEMTIQPLTFS